MVWSQTCHEEGLPLSWRLELDWKKNSWHWSSGISTGIKTGRSLKMRKMIRDYIPRQQNKARLDWQNNLAESEKETRGRVMEWGRGEQDARKPASLPLKTSQAFILPHISGPYRWWIFYPKKVISKDGILLFYPSLYLPTSMSVWCP